MSTRSPSTTSRSARSSPAPRSAADLRLLERGARRNEQNRALEAELSDVAHTSRTNHLIASHHAFGQSLTLGFHLGFLGAVAFVLLGIVAAATIGTRRSSTAPDTTSKRSALTSSPYS